MSSNTAVKAEPKIGFFLYGYTQEWLNRMPYVAIYIMCGAFVLAGAIGGVIDLFTDGNFFHWLLLCLTPNPTGFWNVFVFIVSAFGALLILGGCLFELYRFTGNIKAEGEKSADPTIHGINAEKKEDQKVEEKFSKMVALFNQALTIVTLSTNFGSIYYEMCANGLYQGATNPILWLLHTAAGLAISALFAFLLGVGFYMALFFGPMFWSAARAVQKRAKVTSDYIEKDYQARLAAIAPPAATQKVP